MRTEGQRRTSGQSTKQALSWALFLVASLGVMVGAVARMAAAGPAGIASSTRALAFSHTVTGVTSPPTLSAPEAFVMDATTGVVYYSKNADAEKPMASCTKIMTALLALEHGKLDQVVTIGADAAALVTADSSFMGVSTGEKLTLEDLLYGLLLPSGNDAAIAIADAISGSVPDFVALMNQRAVQLGLAHTHFVTPNGLDLTPDSHYTSARDLTVLAATAARIPEFVKITTTLQSTIPKTPDHKAYDLVTGNDLLPGARSPYPGSIGIKPGYTGLAGFCEAFGANRHGHLIIGTVLGDPSWQVRITDMRALLDWGFANLGVLPAPVVPAWSTNVPDP